MSYLMLIKLALCTTSVLGLPREEDAEDVLLQTFAKIWHNLPKFRGKSSFYTWAYRIARSEASNYRTSQERRPLGHLVTIAKDQTVEFYIENEVERKRSMDEQNRLVNVTFEEFENALRKLPQQMKEAFALKEFDGYKYNEIAELLGVPDGTVRSSISRARDALCEILFNQSRQELRARKEPEPA